MTKPEIIAKIHKCLALSKSANEHEAETALRQARKLMDAHGISDLDVQAAGAREALSKSCAARKPAVWENNLAANISSVFGCRTLFFGGIGAWSYVGCGVAPDLAKYALEVLLRQVKRARAEYIKANLKRCKTATKTRRADLFCMAWVDAVAGKIAAYAGSPAQNEAIEAYIGKHYLAVRDLAVRDRNDGRSLSNCEIGDLIAGRLSGRDAELNRGVGGAERQMIGE